MTITDIKNLIIKLNVDIDVEHHFKRISKVEGDKIMDWNILEAYIVTLFEMINTNVIDCCSAINKFESFIKDISNEFNIVKKEGKIK